MLEKKMRIEIDRDRCVGAAVCVSILPEKFELDSENKSRVKTGKAEEADVLLVAQSCPTQAITVFNSEGKKIS